MNFNPRSPCGERPGLLQTIATRNGFQSTLPVWGATLTWEHWKEFMGISIHAPRVGSDREKARLSIPGDISIHAPRVGSDLA